MSTIRFAIRGSSLGLVLVAVSDEGVCAILLDDDESALEQELARRFPRAKVVREDAALEPLVTKVLALVEDPRRTVDFPLDLRGTPFQQRVWQALRRIPAGETVTYSQLAESIGAPPTAVRAVAGACAANAIAIAIPCHRVLRVDGSLSGYRWGVSRKRVLLAREGAGRSGVLPGV